MKKQANIMYLLNIYYSVYILRLSDFHTRFYKDFDFYFKKLQREQKMDIFMHLANIQFILDNEGMDGIVVFNCDNNILIEGLGIEWSVE